MARRRVRESSGIRSIMDLFLSNLQLPRGCQISSNAKPHCSRDYWEHLTQAHSPALRAEARRVSRYLTLPVNIPSLLSTSARLADQPFHDVFCEHAQKRKLTPPFISSSSTFSPSSLMWVTFLSSTMSSRPRRSPPASRHSLLSSAAHGATSLPSSTNRRRPGSIEKNGDLQHLPLLA